jgi:hypothetical protein
MSLEKCYHANFITENHLSKGLIVVIMKECGLSLGGGDFWDPITWRNVTDRTIRSLYSLTQFVLYVDFKWASKLAKSIYASGRRTVVLIECVLFSAKWEICWLYHGENKSGVFRAKNHDFMPKNLIFAGCAPGSTPANDISIR